VPEESNLVRIMEEVLRYMLPCLHLIDTSPSECYQNFRFEDDSIEAALRKLPEIRGEEFRRIESSRGLLSEAIVIKALDSILEVKLLPFIDDEQTGVPILLQQERFEEINYMASLYFPFPKGLGLKKMVEILQVFITKLGTDILEERLEKVKSLTSDPTRTKAQVGKDSLLIDAQYLRHLRSLYEKYTKVLNPCLWKSIQAAFATFLNDSNLGNSVDIFCNFCNSILQSSGSQAQPTSPADDSNFVFQLLTYISSKDLFLRQYEEQLADRLLSKRSLESEERAAISNLKSRFGMAFTTKMEMMLSDISLSNDRQAHFEEYLKNVSQENGELQPIELSVQVLSCGSWPKFRLCDVALPPVMSQSSKVSASSERRFQLTKPLVGL
jgi:hypothetical protein